MKRIFSFLVCFVSIIMLASCSKDYKVTVHKPEEPIYNIITANYLKVVESIEEFEILIEYNDNLNDFKNDYDEEFFKFKKNNSSYHDPSYDTVLFCKCHRGNPVRLCGFSDRMVKRSSYRSCK